VARHSSRGADKPTTNSSTRGFQRARFVATRRNSIGEKAGMREERVESK